LETLLTRLRFAPPPSETSLVAPLVSTFVRGDFSRGILVGARAGFTAAAILVTVAEAIAVASPKILLVAIAAGLAATGLHKTLLGHSGNG
jgi:hypothetical protein